MYHLFSAKGSSKSEIPYHIHFIGIGGAGMVGLALIMHQKGFSVTGSDLESSPNTDLLCSKEIHVSIGHSPDNLPKHQPLLVVRSSAVSDDNSEYLTAVNKGNKTLRRGEMLAEVAAMYDKTIAIAGTHGKTSVTALLVHLMKTCGYAPGFMIGGKVCGWLESADAGDGGIFITESDESDGTQIHLKSDILLITNVEDDHSWSVGGNGELFANFATIAANAKQVVYNPSDSTEKVLASHNNKKATEFTADFLADKTDWGPFQKENANLAVTAGKELGIDLEKAICEIRKFPGVERRMSIRHQEKDFIVIEDYAHHPTEVKAAITTLRQLFPDYRLRIIFQPHRYARLAKYMDDFASELSQADDVIVVPVFSAWTETGPVNSSDLARKIGKKALFIDQGWNSLAKMTLSSVKKPEVLAIFGAGDVENVISLLKKLIFIKHS